MYELVERIISHSWTTGSSDQQYIYYICGSLIILLTCVFVDMVYRIFRHCWR